MNQQNNSLLCIAIFYAPEKHATSALRPRHTMRQIAATHRGDKSPRLHCCCDRAACAYFVAAICRTNSNQFEFVRQIAATTFCDNDNDFHVSHEAICCSNLSR